MEKINCNISRERLYKGIYEPDETRALGGKPEENCDEFFNAAARLLAKIYLLKEKGC